MLEKLFFYSVMTAFGINLLLFAYATYIESFQFQLIIIANIFLLSFIFLRK